MAGNRCTSRAHGPGLRDESARKTHRRLDDLISRKLDQRYLKKKSKR